MLVIIRVTSHKDKDKDKYGKCFHFRGCFTLGPGYPPQAVGLILAVFKVVAFHALPGHAHGARFAGNPGSRGTRFEGTCRPQLGEIFVSDV